MLKLAASVLFALAGQETPYTADEMAAIQKGVEALVKAGKFLPAAEKLREVKRPRIPPAESAKHFELERKVAGYAALVLETAAGTTADTPKLARIAIKGGGKPLGRIVKDDGVFVTYETLTGIRARVTKENIDTLTMLTAEESAAAVLKELTSQCGTRGLLLSPGTASPFKELGGKKLTGAQYFALAEFAARNGAGEYLAPLFDLALARDPEIRATAHTAKGERLVNQLFYAVTVNQEPLAKYALNALTTRYLDTAAYKDKLFADKEIKEIIVVLMKRDIPEPKLPAVEPPPPPPPGGAPAPLAQTPPPAPLMPEPLPAAAPEPASAPPGVAVTAIRLPSGTPPDVMELVAKGDKNFDEGMKHLLNSDPSINPDGWAKENSAALDLFRKANQESFLPAQEKFEKNWPTALLDRVRETTMRVALCRKRSVRHD